MCRLVFALPFLLLPAPAWSQAAPVEPKPTLSSSPWQNNIKAPRTRSFTIQSLPHSWQNEDLLFVGAEIGPRSTFGVGMYGLKRERSRLAPVTVHEVNAPRTRRAAVGFTFKF